MYSASSYLSSSIYINNIGIRPHYVARSNVKCKEASSSGARKPAVNAIKNLSLELNRSQNGLQRVIEHNASMSDFFQSDRFEKLISFTASVLSSYQLPAIKISPCFYTKRKSNHLIEFLHNSIEQNRNTCLPCTLLNSQLKFVRHFKTDRSIAVELKRNPTILSRLKRAFGGSSPKNENELSSQTETLKKLLQKSGDNKNVENNLKIAFAEGYMAAVNSDEMPKSGKTMKYLKVFQQVLVIVVFIGIFLSLFSSSNGSVFRIQLGNQVEVDPEEIHVTFDDVKGCDEAKQELKEVVEFLKNPEKFSNLGGKLPKGVLLVGPPGTGKTLLARAVAGEANVPFFHAAGPEFDEVLVGQGARRVRDLFKAAKQRAPCVIFIDEIDSVGAKRTNSVLHPYANQTINQLLSEMDGFHQNAGVIVLGATNRRDDLDQALLRPGRFDVEVVVSTPDFTGRKEILSLYLSRILHDEIDLDVLARGTSGFTGADLENMINQAALRAAIDEAETVTMKHLETARDKVLMGPERKARLPDEEANLITAYHEGGHAIVAYFTKESHPLHKVTIMPRGPSLGHTAYIPEKERYHVTKAQLLAMMDTMMGGRAAEELIFGADKITSGASSDLKQATSIATHMVKDWGMSERVGLRTIETSKGILGSEPLGPNTVEIVDAEIKRILNESYERAKLILKRHTKEHKALAEALLKYETLDAEDIKAIMNKTQ
ncbi:ATP-dependent zinc metalloprotease YME1L isoform X1 [Teleopsis dalmanni]|uniref:ATP-dependent zinc metalloprotease YME1L isoform X1 n=1 Tax=Teleopsis dalmanni TaxID=139649 RepID=UPI000D32A365|nr:ATP-dependent zinc metalloprotease YME1L isoform X1 [Teleopsis dalmanni]XP_037943694.1 ATP-dependent zinc metalloprotease YME1L isoform X1 [Teleopsis dalmanni]